MNVNIVASHFFKKLYSPKGRAGRAEMVFFVLYLILSILLLALILSVANKQISTLIFVPLFIFVTIPGFILVCRRLHDLNKSGVFFVITGIALPIIVMPTIIILCFIPGKKEDNKYGSPVDYS